MVSKENEVVQYNFLNDRPTIKDEIGTHSKIAESLLRIINSDLKRPFVVGLFGAWGVGKSSIVEMLQDKVRESKETFKVVLVDAWRMHRETFLREFVKKLARELLTVKQAKVISAETDIRKVKHTSSWVAGPLAVVCFWIFVALVFFLGGLLVKFWLVNPDSKFPASEIALMLLTILIAVYFQYILPKYSVQTGDDVEDVTLHDITHFRKIYFEKIIDQCKTKTVCIVIDNLDRVHAEDAVAIMRIIKTFIVDVEEKGPKEESKDAVPHKILHKVVFIIPCDDEALRKHVVKRYSEESGHEFLRKFFNIGLRIPIFNNRDCYRYSRSLLSQTHLELNEIQTDKISDIIISLFGKNPRQPKIFINNFLARYIVGESFESSNKLTKGIVTEHPDWFAVYIALENEFSDLEMPKTADGLQALLKGDSQGKNEHGKVRRESRVAFLQKVRFTVEKINPKAWSAYYYLKKSNDALLIDGFEELEETALKGTDDFVDKLEVVRAKHPNAVQSLWNVSASGETRVKIMQSILKAKAHTPELLLDGRVLEEIAILIRDKIDNLPMLPADVVYQEILRPNENILCSILDDIVAVGSMDSEPELYRDGAQKEFQVELVREILIDDSNLSVKVLERLDRVVDYLGGRSDSLTIPAIKNGKYPSTNIMGKGITLFREGSNDLCPSDLVTFCGSFKGDKCINYLKQIVDVLNQNITGGKYTTKELCDAAILVKRLVNREDETGEAVAQVNVVNIIKALDTRYMSDNDWESRYAILKTLKEYSEFAKFAQWQNVSRDVLINRGKSFMKSGEENVVSVFLKKEKEMVKSLFNGVLPETAQRSEKLCHVVLDCYPDYNIVAIQKVFPNSPEWIEGWIEKESNRLKKQIVVSENIQSALLAVAPQMDYRMEIYKALSLLDVSSDNAQRNRDNHFSTLIGAKQPLTIPENLAFVLERFLTAQYSGNKEQKSKLEDSFGKMDQDIVSPELRQLIRDYKRFKKRK